MKPDVVVDKFTDASIVKSLIDQHLIFDFVTAYFSGVDSIDSVEDYRFDDFQAFVDYLDAQAFQYDTESEKLLKKLQKASQKDGYDLTEEIAALQQDIKASKKDALQKNQEVIIDLIEKDVASRFYYQKGKIKMGLRNDKEIEEAIALLNDTARYNSILSGQ